MYTALKGNKSIYYCASVRKRNKNAYNVCAYIYIIFNELIKLSHKHLMINLDKDCQTLTVHLQF